MIKLIDETFDPSVWNEVAGHPLQSWEWGVARIKTGLDILRIGEFKGTKLVGVLLVILHPIPYTKYKIGSAPRSSNPTDEMIAFLYDYAQKHNIVHVQFEMNCKEEKRPRLSPRLTKSSNPLFPLYTQTLDLKPTEEALLENMKSKTRYNIRLAQRKGVVVKEMTNKEGFEIFSKLYFETTDRQKYHGHNKEYHRIVFNVLKKSIAHILVVFYNGKPLGAYELFVFGVTLYYPYGGSSDECREVMAPNLLMWEAIRFGKMHGAESFDMWGSLAPDYAASDPWAGFTRFKEGYGTVFTKMIGSYDLVINPFIYSTFSIAYKIRNKII